MCVCVCARFNLPVPLPPGGEISQLPQLLLCVCETVQDEALALIDSTRHVATLGEGLEDRDSMETDNPRSLQKDQRDGVREGRGLNQDGRRIPFD